MASIETNYSVAPLGPGRRRLDRPRRRSRRPVPILPKTARNVAPARPLKTAAGTFDKFVVARSHAVARTLHPGGRHGRLRAAQRRRDRRPAGRQPCLQALAAALRQARRRRASPPAPAPAPAPTPLLDRRSSAAPRWPPSLPSGDVWAAYVGTVTYVARQRRRGLRPPRRLRRPVGPRHGQRLRLRHLVQLDLAVQAVLARRDARPDHSGPLLRHRRRVIPDSAADTPEVPVDASAALGGSLPLPSTT